MKEFPFTWVMAPKTWTRTCLTPGKVYKVLSFRGYSPTTGYTFSISDDSGCPIYCIERINSLSSNEDWIIVDYQKNLENILK